MLVETLNRNTACQQRWQADQSETPVLMALLLACWRWLLPTAAGFGPPRHSARARNRQLSLPCEPAPASPPSHLSPLRLLI